LTKGCVWLLIHAFKVIGHRGAGANKHFSGTGNLQIGENTVLSLVTAASLGAEYVEFDVQLTKDLVPVIYHDWKLSETGLNIPVSTVTLEEFRSLGPQNKRNRLRKMLTKKLFRRSESLSDDESSTGGRVLARGFSSFDLEALNHRHDEDWDANEIGMRPRKHNGGRGDVAIKAPFATLAETFAVCRLTFHTMILFESNRTV
jgi:hypothetical protein